MNRKNSGRFKLASVNDSTLLVARLSYILSRRTTVYGMVGRINDGGGTVGAGMNQNGVMAGLRHTF